MIKIPRVYKKLTKLARVEISEYMGIDTRSLGFVKTEADAEIEAELSLAEAM